MPGELIGVGAKCRECWGIQGKAKGTYGSGCKLPGNCSECRGMPGERMRVEEGHKGMQENVGESRGIQGNTRGTYGSGSKVPGDCWGMQGNAKETYRSECKLPGVCTECR